MKKVIFLGLVITVIITCCAQQEAKSPLEGTWQLTNGKGLSPDTTIIYPGINGKHWKIITKSHFATIYQDTTSDKFLTNGFNGGTCTFIDGIYTENFTHSSLPSQIGRRMLFKAKIEGNKLFITPCSEDGTDEKYGNFEEYKRLD